MNGLPETLIEISWNHCLFLDLHTLSYKIATEDINTQELRGTPEAFPNFPYTMCCTQSPKPSKPKRN